MNTDLDSELTEFLESLDPRMRTSLIVRSILDTREVMRAYIERHETKPRIEIYRDDSLLDQGASLNKVAAEREQYRHDFATMSDRAAELSVQVAGLEERVRELATERDVLRRALDGAER